MKRDPTPEEILERTEKTDRRNYQRNKSKFIRTKGLKSPDKGPTEWPAD